MPRFGMANNRAIRLAERISDLYGMNMLQCSRIVDRNLNSFDIQTLRCAHELTVYTELTGGEHAPDGHRWLHAANTAKLHATTRYQE